MAPLDLDDFLRPLAIDGHAVLRLSHRLAFAFTRLAAESMDQFLPTPISESMLRPTRKVQGRYLAIDIGGTNLRVGLVELFHYGAPEPYGVVFEERWPIEEHLKNDDQHGLFSWIGKCVARAVRRACADYGMPPDRELPMGVTFSFPMQQPSLSEAILMPMGKGFALKADIDLPAHLVAGYESHRDPDLPPIRIAAIANDSVSTLVSFAYKLQAHHSSETPKRRAAMALIVGTGCNATLPLRLGSLHPSKWPASVTAVGRPRHDEESIRIAVNTEWSINGSAPPLRDLGLVTPWDEALDRAGERPGFQPLEYMTAGRYLGELVRLVFVDYYSAAVGKAAGEVILGLPEGFRRRFGLPTALLGTSSPTLLLQRLEEEFPPPPPEENGNGEKGTNHFRWTPELAEVLYLIAKAVQVRAAGIIAAATLGLLRSAGELPPPPPPPPPPSSSPDGQVYGGCETNGYKDEREEELAVGYTGSCITNFLDYLEDTQKFVDEALRLEYATAASGGPVPRVVLVPCPDGGLAGAGILVPATLDTLSKVVDCDGVRNGDK